MRNRQQALQFDRDMNHQAFPLNCWQHNALEFRPGVPELNYRQGLVRKAIHPGGGVETIAPMSPLFLRIRCARLGILEQPSITRVNNQLIARVQTANPGIFIFASHFLPGPSFFSKNFHAEIPSQANSSSTCKGVEAISRKAAFSETNATRRGIDHAKLTGVNSSPGRFGLLDTTGHHLSCKGDFMREPMSSSHFTTDSPLISLSFDRSDKSFLPRGSASVRSDLNLRQMPGSPSNSWRISSHSSQPTGWRRIPPSIFIVRQRRGDVF